MRMEELVSTFARRRSYSAPSSPCLGFEGRARKSFSYSKLPEVPLKLTVLKLDGSSFEIQVMKSATIAEMKLAVEAVFSHLPRKGPGKISWSQVWGDFCLCYDGQKLITDTHYIKIYGIKDGDKLQFIRHLSTNYNIPRKKRQMKRTTASEQPKNSLSRSSTYEAEERNYEGEDYGVETGSHSHQNHLQTKDDAVEKVKSRRPHFFLELFCYSTAEVTSFKASSGSSGDFLVSFRKILLNLCSNKRYSQKGFTGRG
ncbi:hypothetical protein K2173_026079 [Erythroxylum novogranatense]|uniref:SNRNP25 ubiquitin-like domain-containing protein n=1 Tax=Erythroxylum novogranatense TaxID=1862640 RepID=A0AAV8SI31_9ROSI|nr:hypothetical protein K2173_026079 [Erythroxylum novogranatense]